MDPFFGGDDRLLVLQWRRRYSVKVLGMGTSPPGLVWSE